MLSKYTLLHELNFPEIHTWSDLTVLLGVIATFVAIFYFVILKTLDWSDRRKEHNIFMEDITDEIERLTKSPDKYVLTWNESKKSREGDLGYFSLDTFSLFNNKYRHLFDKNTREIIGKLNLVIEIYNLHVKELANMESAMTFRNQGAVNELRANIDLNNEDLKNIIDRALEIKTLLDNYKKPNWFKQKWNKLFS